MDLAVVVVVRISFLLFCRCFEILYMVVFCVEFQEFVRNQEACRKRWHESHAAASHLKTSLAEKEQENVTLQTKLKHARCVVDLSYFVSFWEHSCVHLAFFLAIWHCLHSMWSRICAAAGHLSACSFHWPLHATAVGLLLWARRYRPVAAWPPVEHSNSGKKSFDLI